jgi:hypothetical protein
VPHLRNLRLNSQDCQAVDFETDLFVTVSFGIVPNDLIVGTFEPQQSRLSRIGKDVRQPDHQFMREMVVKQQAHEGRSQ